MGASGRSHIRVHALLLALSPFLVPVVLRPETRAQYVGNEVSISRPNELDSAMREGHGRLLLVQHLDLRSALSYSGQQHITLPTVLSSVRGFCKDSLNLMVGQPALAILRVHQCVLIVDRSLLGIAVDGELKLWLDNLYVRLQRARDAQRTITPTITATGASAELVLTHMTLQSDGGSSQGLVVQDLAMLLQDCTFKDFQAEDLGAAVDVSGSASVALTRCTFANNRGALSAVHAANTSSLRLEGCTFEDSSETDIGVSGSAPSVYSEPAYRVTQHVGEGSQAGVESFPLKSAPLTFLDEEVPWFVQLKGSVAGPDWDQGFAPSYPDVSQDSDTAVARTSYTGIIITVVVCSLVLVTVSIAALLWFVVLGQRGQWQPEEGQSLRERSATDVQSMQGSVMQSSKSQERLRGPGSIPSNSGLLMRTAQGELFPGVTHFANPLPIRSQGDGVPPPLLFLAPTSSGQFPGSHNSAFMHSGSLSTCGVGQPGGMGLMVQGPCSEGSGPTAAKLFHGAAALGHPGSDTKAHPGKHPVRSNIGSHWVRDIRDTGGKEQAACAPGNGRLPWKPQSGPAGTVANTTLVGGPPTPAYMVQLPGPPGAGGVYAPQPGATHVPQGWMNVTALQSLVPAQALGLPATAAMVQSASAAATAAASGADVTDVVEKDQEAQDSGLVAANSPRHQRSDGGLSERGPDGVIELLMDALNCMHGLQMSYVGKYFFLSETERHVGGQGVVQFARAVHRSTEYAIKFYTARSAFDRECELYNNPAFVDIMPSTEEIISNDDHAIRAPDGFVFPPAIIIEKGESLDVWAQRHDTRDFITIMQVLCHIAEKLNVLHSHGWVHRDLKPGNVLRRPRQHSWTLIDFGCSARAGSSVKVTLSGGYTPPEAVTALERGQQNLVASPSADVWALGVIAYELLTQGRIFPLDITPEDMLDQCTARKPLPWEPGAPHADEHVKQLRGLKRTVLRCLDRNPRERPSCKELLMFWGHMFDITLTSTQSTSASRER